MPRSGVCGRILGIREGEPHMATPRHGEMGVPGMGKKHHGASNPVIGQTSRAGRTGAVETPETHHRDGWNGQHVFLELSV